MDRRANLSSHFLADAPVSIGDDHKVRHQTQHHHFQAFFTSREYLGYRAHPHHIRANAPQESALGRCFVGRTADPCISALRQRRVL